MKLWKYYRTRNEVAKDVDKLIEYIDATITEVDKFLQTLEISLDKIIGEANTLYNVDLLINHFVDIAVQG